MTEDSLTQIVEFCKLIDAIDGCSLNSFRHSRLVLLSSFPACHCNVIPVLPLSLLA
ncbi:MAG: hypothetical protein ACI3ZP_09370 [Candidatus Cryptobacteroides sp.]